MKVSQINASLQKGSYLLERVAEQKASQLNDHRFKQWLEVGGFTEETFRQRLAKEGLSIDEFLNIIGNEKVITHNPLPLWISKLNQIIEAWEPDSNSNRKGIFITFYEPFLSYSMNTLQKELEGMARKYDKDSFIDIPKVVGSIVETLYRKLQQLSIRTLISEMHIAKITDHLVGETSEERYHYFVHTLLDNKKHIWELLQIYPVLGRLMVETVERGIATHVEAIERFFIDFDAICANFVGDFSCLTEVKAGAGDTHQGGRSVSLFTFKSGDCLVYKPRSLAVDEHFSEFIAWINEKGFTHALISPQVLNRDIYGWQEFIPYRECKSPEEIRRFYYRQGGYIALLYLLRSSDFHAENIIAHGEQPILIDLETLFSNQTGIRTVDKLSKPAEELNNSVFSSMMLPVKFSSNMYIDFDVSAIGGEGGQVSKKIKSWTLEQPYTDEMRLVQKAAVFEESKNRPTLQGEVVQPIDYTQEIEAGFQEMYELFLTYRKELMSESGLIHRFAGDQIRHVLRPTHTYGSFLEASTHPDYLQDGLHRVRLFEYFWRITSTFPKFSEVVSLECRDLLEHDVPYFTFKVGEKDIYDGKGNKIANFYEKTCIELVMERCASLSREDCEKQSRYIRMSLVSLLKNVAAVGSEERNFSLEENLPVREEFLKEAVKIGDELIKQAIWSDDGEEAYWIGLNIVDTELFVSPLGTSLYEGSLGIILFLGHLAKETGDKKYEELARKSLNGIKSMIEKDHSNLPVSAFYGDPSLSYGFAHLGLLWNDKTLIYQAYQYIDKVEKNLKSDRELDLIGGAAGALLVSLRLHKLDPHSRALEIAEKCGEHLLQHVQFEKKEENALGLLTGLSHGTAAYAWAWLELAHFTGQERFLQAGRKALSYERSYFLPKENNWADLRRNEQKRTPVFWCHGAPGIGLARLMILDYFDDPQVYGEWQIAVKKTLEDGFGYGHSLCHGDFGNLDFLFLSAKKMKDAELEQKSLEIGYQSMKWGITHGWQLGLHRQAELIGLMLGISGIGYGLLRLWNPEIPSVLSFELPTKEEVAR